MKQETAAYLAKAEQSLNKARRVLAIDILDESGRHAYYAAFHAAQALIFEHTDRASKSHKGVKTQFARFAKSEPRIERQLSTFLARAYQLKSAADYEIGTADIITAVDIRDAIASAEHFVTVIRQVLTTPLVPPSP